MKSHILTNRSWRALVITAALVSLMIGVVGKRISEINSAPPLYQPEWYGSWILGHHSEQYKTFFRKTFNLSGNVTSAWVQMAADNEYTLFVNGRRVSSNLHLSSNLYGFQSALNDPGQRFSKRIMYKIAYHPDMQWAALEEWRIATLYDIQPYLVKGQNVIAVYVQNNHKHGRLILNGEALLEGGTSVSLHSNESWKTNMLEEVKDGVQWYESSFSDTHWEYAAFESDIKDLGYPKTVVDPTAFMAPLKTKWIRTSTPVNSNLFLRRTLYLETIPEDGWLRIYSDSPYDIFVNEHRVDLGRLLYRDRSSENVLMLAISPLLKKGKNIIAINVHPDLRVGNNANLKQIYIDGLLKYGKGNEIWIEANDDWRASVRYDKGWTEKAYDDSDWNSVVTVPFLQTGIVKRYFGTELDLLSYWRYGAIVAIATFLPLMFGLSLFVSLLRQRFNIEINESARTATYSLLPSAVLIGTAIVLDHRFELTTTTLLFNQSSLWQGVLILSLILMGSCLAISWFTRAKQVAAVASTGNTALLGQSGEAGVFINSGAYFSTYAYRFIILAIFLLGAYLRIKNLGFEWLQNDEVVSISAALGIIETGAPEYPSGVWYTRGSVYHYILASFLYLFGTSPEVARLPSVLFGIGLLAMMYKMALDLSGRQLVALLVLGVLAISPWAIYTSRMARFYSLMQFFTVAAVYCYIKGFIQSHSKKHQALFFICYIIAFLSQEIVILIAPSFVIGYLLFAKPFSWREDKALVLWIVVFILAAFIDIITFDIRCLTNIAAISAATGSVLSLHLTDPFEFFTSMLVGQDRSAVLLSLLFLAGAPLWFYKQDRIFFFIYLLIGLMLFLSTILILQVRLRYVYGVYPLFVLAACASFVGLFWPSKIKESRFLVGEAPARFFATAVSFIIITTGIIWSYQPLRLLDSYDKHINAGEMEAFKYAVNHRRKEDIIITTHPQLGPYFSVKSDYYLVSRPAFDEVFRKSGVLIERWGGGELIDSVDKLRYELERVERAWVVISDRRFSARSDDEINIFLKFNLRPIYHTFSSNVYLWERSRGMVFMPEHYQRERNLF